MQERQTRLAEIRLRERRTTLQFTLGTFFIWFAYVSLWYTRTLPSAWHESKSGTAGMVVGPILYVAFMDILHLVADSYLDLIESCLRGG